MSESLGANKISLILLGVFFIFSLYGGRLVNVHLMTLDKIPAARKPVWMARLADRIVHPLQILDQAGRSFQTATAHGSSNAPPKTMSLPLGSGHGSVP